MNKKENSVGVIKEIDNEDIYLVHSTINIYNKRRSNWEYSQTMAKLLDGKEITFQGFHKLELDNKKVKVYYTDERINKLKMSFYEQFHNKKRGWIISYSTSS